jgi:hypothetical protein
MFYNSIEGNLQRIVDHTELVQQDVFKSDQPDQRRVNQVVSTLTGDVERLARIVQIIASKQKIMSETTDF